MVDLEYLAGDVIALEATNVLTAVLDTFLAPWGTLQHLTDGCSQSLRIVWSNIETVRSACLL